MGKPLRQDIMGISRDSRHKRSASGAQRAHYRKKRKFELGRQGAMTKIGTKRIHTVRVRGGNTKHRALRLESGNYAWGSEQVTRKQRAAKDGETSEPAKQSAHVKRTIEGRKAEAKIDPLLESQFQAGRLYAFISSRPGQSGRADGYILEGKELEFYVRKLRDRKAKHAA